MPAKPTPKKINPPQAQKRQPGQEHQMHPRPDYEPRYPGSNRLKGKVAIISGGDSGIGRAVSVLFAREGAKVAILYLNEERDAKDTAALVEAEGSEVLLIKGDIGKKVFAERAVNRVITQFGRLDIVINNAAEQHEQKDLTDISEAQLVKTFRTNIFGYFFLTQAALPHLKRGA